MKEFNMHFAAALTALLLVLTGACPTYAASPWDAELDSGRNAYHRGDYKQALQSWSAAEEKVRAGNKPASLLNVLRLKAEAHRALGQHSDALLALNEALTLSKDNPVDDAMQASILSSYGDSLEFAGVWLTAKQVLDKSVEVARKSGNNKLLASTLNNYGNNLYKRGYYITAVDAYQEASDIAGRMGDTLTMVQAMNNIARVYVTQNDYATVADIIEPLIKQVADLPETHAKTAMHIALGNMAIDIIDKGNPSARSVWMQQAYNLLNTADQIAGRLADRRSQSYTSGYLGKLYLSQNRLDEATLLTDKATRIAQEVKAPESEYLWHWQAAKIYRKQNDIDSAISAYRLAVENLQSIRQELPTRTAFKEILGPVFFELTDLLLQRPNDLQDKAKSESYFKEARQTMELLKAAELQDYFQDNCVTALQARTTGLDNLKGRTAVLYPILLADRMEILLSTPSGMDRAVSRISADELRAKINAFRLQLVDYKTNDYMKYSRELYDLLIRPMEPILKANNINTLVIVPDSALRTIPMAALNDGKDFLISRYALAVTPGLTLTDAIPLKRDKLDVLVGGLTEGVQGFSALPNVALEVDNIKKNYKSTILMNKDYNVPEVETELTRTNFNIVHIASHAQFSKNPEDTFLLAHEGKFTMDKLETLMNQTKYRDDPVELLTLSACQTAAGDERAALGLAGIAIKAGARSALATLWFINDKASSLLISDFYDNLKDPNLSKAQALQKAQLAIMSEEKYQHPLFWSPFLLIGNWL